MQLDFSVFYVSYDFLLHNITKKDIHSPITPDDWHKTRELVKSTVYKAISSLEFESLASISFMHSNPSHISPKSIKKQEIMIILDDNFSHYSMRKPYFSMSSKFVQTPTVDPKCGSKMKQLSVVTVLLSISRSLDGCKRSNDVRLGKDKIPIKTIETVHHQCKQDRFKEIETELFSNSSVFLDIIDSPSQIVSPTKISQSSSPSTQEYPISSSLYIHKYRHTDGEYSLPRFVSSLLQKYILPTFSAQEKVLERARTKNIQKLIDYKAGKSSYKSISSVIDLQMRKFIAQLIERGELPNKSKQMMDAISTKKKAFVKDVSTICTALREKKCSKDEEAQIIASLVSQFNSFTSLINGELRNSMSNLRTKCLQKDDRIKSLRLENEKLRYDNEKHKELHSNNAKEIVKLKNRISDLSEALQAAKDLQGDSFVPNLVSLKEEKQQHAEKYSKLLKQFERVRQDLVSSDRDKKDSQEECHEMALDNIKLKEEIAEYKAKYSLEQSNVELLIEEVKRLESLKIIPELESLRSENTRLVDMITDMKQSLSTTTERFDELERKYRQLCDDMKEAEEVKSELRSSVAAMKEMSATELDDHVKRNEEAEKLIASLESEKAHLNTECSRLEEENARLSEKVLDAEEAKSQLQSAHTKSTNQLHEIEQKNASLASELADLRDT
ncbi:hypothetical protein ADUPG1_007739, partial [Aduncisulcus paluster]